MSKATEVSVEASEYNDITDWAVAAVRGSNNWLVTLRNATDEGINEWSDEFSGGKNGIMSYAEALTALGLAQQHAPVEQSDWQTLRQRYYEKDLQKILDWINDEDGPQFRPDPYLTGDKSSNSGIHTQNFTVSATFATSAILETIESGIEFGPDIETSDIEDALRTNLSWLLDNRIDDVETENAAGWAWVGEKSEHYGDLDRPANYFTYSAVIVLCDFLQYRKHDVVDTVVSDREDDLKEAIDEAHQFLLNEYWDDDHWTVPTGQLDTADEIEELLSTCYGFIGLSYIAFTRDAIEMTSEQKEQMGEAMNWALNYYEEDPNLWARTVEYECGQETDQTFTDGSAPYVLLDSMVELLNFRGGIIEEMSGWSEDDIEEAAHQKLAPVILDKCWAGDQAYEEKGFRHIGNGELLLQRADGSPDHNMTAIYSTGVAMETFLLNVLEEGSSIPRETEKSQSTETSSKDLSAEGDISDVQRVEKRTVNNIILDGESSSYPDEIDEQLANIQSEVEQLSDEVSKTASEETESGLDKRGLDFMQQLDDLALVLAEEYTIKRNWKDGICQELGKAKQSLGSSQGSEWPHLLKRINKENFITYLTQVYFCSDQETYEDNVKLSEYDTNLLLPPQHGIVTEINDKDSDFFTDSDERRGYVEQAVADMIAEPWGGQEVPDAMHEFEQRYKNRVMKN